METLDVLDSVYICFYHDSCKSDGVMENLKIIIKFIKIWIFFLKFLEKKEKIWDVKMGHGKECKWMKWEYVKYAWIEYK